MVMPTPLKAGYGTVRGRQEEPATTGQFFSRARTTSQVFKGSEVLDKALGAAKPGRTSNFAPRRAGTDQALPPPAAWSSQRNSAARRVWRPADRSLPGGSMPRPGPAGRPKGF